MSSSVTAAHRRALTGGGGRHARCQLHIRSSLGFSVLLSNTSLELGFEPATFRSLADLLDLLSNSCPKKKIFLKSFVCLFVCFYFSHMKFW